MQHSEDREVIALENTIRAQITVAILAHDLCRRHAESPMHVRRYTQYLENAHAEIARALVAIATLTGNTDEGHRIMRDATGGVAQGRESPGEQTASR